MSTIDSQGAADIFLTRAIQDWPHHRPAMRIAAVQQVLDMCGFDAKARSWPAFGRIFPQPCVGPDGAEAQAWLENLCEHLPRGDAHVESEFIKQAIDERIALMEGRLT